MQYIIIYYLKYSRKTANDPLFIEGLKGLERPRAFRFPVDYTYNNYDV